MKTNIEKTVEQEFENFIISQFSEADRLYHIDLITNETRLTLNGEKIKQFLTQALTSQAQMMVDIVKVKANSLCGEYNEAEKSFFVMGQLQTLDDILTSYKESGLIK